VAVIELRLDAQADIALVMQGFQMGSACTLAEAPQGRIFFGSWSGEDVVIVRTAEYCWEINCHGGTIAVHRICQDLAAAGLRTDIEGSASNESFQGRIERVTNEALLKCRTRKTAGLVLAQQDGRLLKFAEDLQSESNDRSRSARQHMQRWQSVAQHLTKPWRVAIVGEPNVGKSSLINTIAGLQRSIVSATPGTTRDLVEADIVVRGWMFRLIDTAGVRSDSDSLTEQLGIVQSLALLGDCEMICLVVDGSSGQFESVLMDRLKKVEVPICVVRNKYDILSDSENTGVPLCASSLDSVHSITATVDVSAKTGFGISELLTWIAETAVPEEPLTEIALPFVELFGPT
jgi:tRNA modification GTPase